MHRPSPLPQKDRRENPLIPMGTYTPGIARVEETALKDLRAHDDMWRSMDDPAYQSDYSLENHCVAVGNVMAVIGNYRQRAPQMIDLGHTAGLVHDIGKMEKECWMYRRKGLLSVSERICLVRMHMDFARTGLRSMGVYARDTDRVYLDRLESLIAHHHEPWEIGDSELRSIGTDLFLADYFVSRMESRWKSGLSQFEAVRKLERFVSENFTTPGHADIQAELGESLDSIRKLFGWNSMDYPLRVQV